MVAEYNRKIKRQGDAAEKTVERAIKEFFRNNPDATIEDVRDFAFECMQAAADLYGNACSQAALDLQYEIAEEFGVKPPDIGGWWYEADKDSIAATAQKHSSKLESGDRAGFIREIRKAARYYAERGANSTMAQTAKKQARSRSVNSRRKGSYAQGVKFARVPMGAVNCDFCIMLASRGFDYLTEESAGEFDQYHPNCDCRIIPNYGNAGLEGYDRDYYLDCYEHPEDHPEIREAQNARRRERYAERKMWELATDDAKKPLDEKNAKRLAEYFDRTIESRKARFRDDLRKEVYEREIGSLLSDIGKVYGMSIKGECLIGPKLQSAMPDGYEIWAATRMGGRFDEIQFLGEDRRRRKGNPDLIADGVYVDIKTPENVAKVKDRIHEGYMQCRNRGQQEGFVILSSMRVKDKAEQHKFVENAMSTVSRKRRNEQELKVFVVSPDSAMVEI